MKFPPWGRWNLMLQFYLMLIAANLSVPFFKATVAGFWGKVHGTKEEQKVKRHRHFRNIAILTVGMFFLQGTWIPSINKVFKSITGKVRPLSLPNAAKNGETNTHVPLRQQIVQFNTPFWRPMIFRANKKHGHDHWKFVSTRFGRRSHEPPAQLVYSGRAGGGVGLSKTASPQWAGAEKTSGSQ